MAAITSTRPGFRSSQKWQTRLNVAATLTAQGKLCASCHGVFQAVGEGHPAFHRW